MSKLQRAVQEEITEFAWMIKNKTGNILEEEELEIRNKKALEFVGEMIHTLTGVSGPTQYRHNQEMFKAIQSVVQNLENENDKGRKAVELMHNLQEIQTKQIGITSNKIKGLMTENLFMNGVLIFRSNAMKITRTLNEEVEKIRRIAEKAKAKKISMDLLSSRDLKKHTNHIKKSEKNLTPIFMGKEVQNYYSLELVTSVIKRNRMYVFTRIPLVDFREKHIIEPFVMKGSHNLEYLVLNAKKNALRSLCPT